MIVTQSTKMKQLIDFAQRAGRSSAPILLTGESGTGKELFAKLIHESSPRTSRPLVTLNCAALSEALIESELFGHEKGAFTDAHSTRKGRFELADRGTLLLDEISEIPISVQAKLLRVLESKRFERVGNSESIEHDVRLIAASNRDLAREVDAGEFRLDLYHRINVIEIRIPPLRDRRSDIPLLAMHFVRMFAHENEIKIDGLEANAMKALCEYHWPGNVRELRNVIHRGCVLADDRLITPEQLALPEQTPRDEPPSNQLPEHWLHTELADIERQIITAAIERFGNQRVAAEKLGVSPRTLTNKIRKYREDSVEDDAHPQRRAA
jgi:DNA-binding NtrC family response regulator